MVSIGQVWYVTKIAIFALFYRRINFFVSTGPRHQNLPKEKYRNFDNLLTSVINGVLLGVGSCFSL
jgi:hypothetical protein